MTILTVTLDRFDIATQYFGPALERAGYPFQVMAVDNGSQDKRIVDYIASFNPVWHARRESNEGYAAALNQMLLRVETEYVCIIDPDILPEQQNWLRDLIETDQAIRAEGVRVPGSSGVRCIFEYDEEMDIAGRHIFRTWNAFGTKFYNKTNLDVTGYYCEEYGKYGNEDIDMNFRLNKLGFLNYYIPGLAAHHNDVLDTTPYRMGKWKALEHAGKVWERREKYMNETHDYYVPPPPLLPW